MQKVYTKAEVEKLIAQAYQQGINYGYSLAIEDELPQIRAMDEKILKGENEWHQ